MPRLSKLRLVSVGHPDARFEDVTLDFRDAEGLAADTSVWLRNGGGKSSLLSLFYATLLPNRREFLGRKADASRRELGEYIQPDDLGVVACEWELDRLPLAIESGPRHLVTGVFYEWRTLSPPDLQRLYFAFESGEPGALPSLEALPLLVSAGEGSRRRRLAGFRSALGELRAAHPAANVLFTDEQREWLKYLDAANLDPELFACQVRMNEREGGADEVFKFRDHEAFVDFLIDLAFDPRHAEEVDKLIAKFRKELVDRKDRWLPERNLVEGLLERLAPLARVASQRAGSLDRLAVIARDLDAHDRFIATRRGAIATGLVEQETLRAEHQAACSQERSDLSTAARLAIFACYRAAKVRLEQAAADLSRSANAVETATRERDRWTAADPLFRALDFERQERDFQEALEAKLRKFRPLLEQVKGAARDYAAALNARRDRHLAIAAGAEAETRGATERAAVQDERAAAAKAEAARTQARLDEVRRLLATGQRERRRLRQSGAIGPTESGEDAALRLRRSHGELAKAIEAASGGLKEIGARAEATRLREADAARRAQAAELRGNQFEEGLVGAQELRQRLEASELLRQVLENDAPDLTRFGQADLERLRGEARAALEAVFDLRATLARDERALVHLTEHHLLPPRPDVLRVLGRLTGHIAAWSGWTYLADAVKPGHWREAIARHPALVDGVIVRDADFERAKQLLEGAADEVENPVSIGRQACLTDCEREPMDPGVLVVGPRSPAWFDRLAAAREQEALDERQRAGEIELRRQDELRRDIERLASELEAFARDFPAGWFEERAGAISAEREEEAVAERERDACSEELASQSAQRSSLEGAREKAREEQTATALQLQEVERFVADHECLEEAFTRELESLQRARGVAEATGAEAAGLAATERQLADAARQEAEAARQEARSDRDATERIRRVVAADVAGGPGDVEALGRKYDLLEAQYAGSVGAEALEGQRNLVAGEARKARDQFRRTLRGDLAEADVLAAVLECSGADELDRRKADADRAYQSAIGTKGNATQRHETAQSKLNQVREEMDKEDAAPEDLPSEVAALSAPEADALFQDLTRETERLLAAVEDREQRASQAVSECSRLQALLGAVHQLADSFVELRNSYEDLLARLPESVVPGEPGLPLSDEKLAEAFKDLSAGLKTLRTESRRLDAASNDAADTIRGWASHPQFESLRSALAKRFVQLPAGELEARAGDLRTELELRQKNLDRLIAEVETQRSLVIGALVDVQARVFALLRGAENASRLPLDVPGTGRAKFLHIAAEPPQDPGELRGKLGTLVDDLLDAGAAEGGLALAKRVVRKLARRIRVRVVKPDPDAPDRAPVDITGLAKFSGGERLTAAILLYCTLANLRARNRGRETRTGVLLLDNPVGTASRVSFLEMQRRVAHAMGVQLIYATGVNDLDAIGTLPNVIRLRNDHFDRRTGRKLVEAERPPIVAVRVGRAETSAEVTRASGIER